MYLTPNQAYKEYGFHPKTLARWSDEGLIKCIRSPGGHRRYSKKSLENINITETTKATVLYARVSSQSQKDDLDSQIKYLGSHYPGSRCVSEIGSGMNFKRKKFLNLMAEVLTGQIGVLVVAHKDRLARFGFDFLEWYCDQFGCKIIVINNVYKTPRQELLDDFMSIMHTFSSKLYFLRTYEKNIKKKIEKGIDNSE